MIFDWGLTLALCKACFTGVVPTPPFTGNELLYLPVLRTEVQTYWPDLPSKAALAAQVRQETCPSLKSKLCWSPRAELKTEREYGFGLGQLTVTAKFDNFKAATKLDKSLKDWTWENRYNAQFQLRTMVLMDKFNYGKFSFVADPRERMAFTLAGYNGGIGGVLSDRLVCKTVVGCDQNRWFGHVEHTSKKAKVAANGYGQSFFQINRGYVKNVLDLYTPRYRGYFEESAND